MWGTRMATTNWWITREVLGWSGGPSDNFRLAISPFKFLRFDGFEVERTKLCTALVFMNSVFKLILWIDLICQCFTFFHQPLPPWTSTLPWLIEGKGWTGKWDLANDASRYLNVVYMKAEYTWWNTEMYCFLGTCVCLLSWSTMINHPSRFSFYTELGPLDWPFK